MRTTIFSSVPHKFLTALAVIAMVLAALPAMSAHAASITVTNPVDDLTNGNGCSLREAIINANNNGSTYPDCVAGSSGVVDVITLASGSTYTLSLTGASLNTTGDLDISDPAGLTIQADGATPAIIDGGDIDRVLDVALGSGNVTLTGITVQNGTTTTGAGINFGSNATLTLTNSSVLSNVGTATAGCGAGIYNNTAATINITNSTIADNACAGIGADGSGMFKGAGGAVNISNSTFYGNNTQDDGGAMRLDLGTVAITNSTFYNNTAGNRGGAIQVSGATATIEFSTFSDNTANGAGTPNGGGAIQVSAGSAAINRSILANSAPVTAKDCDQSATGSGAITNSLVEAQNDCSGTPTSTADPALGALGSNGGPTQTMAITSSSPAYNAALSCNSIATDQRGIVRPQGVACDLGAYEVPDLTAPTVVSIVAASPNPTSAASVDYTVTFSEAVTGVGSSDFALTIGGGLTGASVGTVSGSGAIYTVSVNTGTGNGTLRLDVPLSASFSDLNGNAFAGPAFTTGAVYTKSQSIPGSATLTSPNGSILTNQPTYTWNAVFDATWYYLWVDRPSGDPIKIWYDASTPGVCGASTCSVTPAATLAGGAHTWWIQTWNPVGYGAWSTGKTFSVTPLAAATLVSPNGAIANHTPSFTWNKVAGATWYYLWVNGPSGNVIQQWYPASNTAVCPVAGSTCSVTSPVTLGSGSHTWWIQTYNDGAYGPWSTGMGFSLP